MLCIARTELLQGCLSIYLSVCHTPLLCQTGSTYHRLFHCRVDMQSSFCSNKTFWQYSDGAALMGALNAGAMKKLRFLTNISLFLRNNTR